MVLLGALLTATPGRAQETISIPPVDVGPSPPPASRRQATKRPASRGKGGANARCEMALVNSERLEHEDRLREARDLLLLCERPACGDFLMNECSARHLRLGAAIPSIVLVATKDGDPVVDLRVDMDGNLLAPRLDGRSVEVDPGTHVFSFTRDGQVVAVRRVLVAAGQHDVSVAVTEAPAGSALVSQPGSSSRSSAPSRAPEAPIMARPGAGASRAPSPAGRSNLLPFVLGGSGLLLAGAGAAFIVVGRNDAIGLAQCLPGCPQSSIAQAEGFYYAGDIAVGLGAIAIGLGVWQFLTNSPQKPDAASADAMLRLDVMPDRDGAVASLTARF